VEGGDHSLKLSAKDGGAAGTAKAVAAAADAIESFSRLIVRTGATSLVESEGHGDQSPRPRGKRRGRSAQQVKEPMAKKKRKRT
jgi:hypothetical protein